MTVAPIYLVSACTSGEEFVAAFRRYADKHGLFVPIGVPFASGRRSRFAVTLRDGGVMIEGEAEIVSSARTPSVLHGRVGMTLRFVEPDAASQTMLGELEKARLSMRPPPPSVAPRPAALPAAPRPVPPAAQGRIDAVNALAECVAIGEPELLESLALAAPTASPPKAGPRFVVPTIAPAVRGKSSTAPPVVDRGPTSDTMIVAAPPEPPARSAAGAQPAPGARAPSAELAVALPRTGTRRGVEPAAASTMNAGTMDLTVPLPRASSPTDIGGAIVDPLPEPGEPAGARGLTQAEPDAAIVVHAPAREDGSARTQVHAGIPPREPATTPREPAPIHDRSAPASRGPLLASRDANATARGVVPAASGPRPSRQPTPPPEAASPRSFAHAPNAHTIPGAASDLAQTMRSPPPEMAELRANLATRLGMQPARRADAAPASAPQPSPPIVAAARPIAPEVEIAEPTDLSMGPPEPSPSDALDAIDPNDTRDTNDLGDPSDPGDALATDGSTQPEIQRPRTTVVGVAVVPSDRATAAPALRPPSFAFTGAAAEDRALTAADDRALTAADDRALTAADDRALTAADEPTGADRVVEGDGDDPNDAGAREAAAALATTQQPAISDPTASEEPAAGEEPTPSEYWTIAPGGALAPTPKRTRTPTGVARFNPSTASPASGSPAVSPPGARAAGAVPATAATSAPGSGPASTARSGASQAVPATGAASPSGRMATVRSTGAAAKPAETAPSGGVLPPTGDWLIALDPAAPDGWSEPFETVPAHMLGDDPPAAPRAKRGAPRADAMPVTEPKVQVDPTLIEPLTPLPMDDSFVRTSSPDLSMYAPGFPATGMPGGPPPFGPAPGFGPPPAFGPPNAAPAYPLDPGYQMMPVAAPAAPRATTAGGSGSGFADPRYPSDAALPVSSSKRRVIIVLASAIVAVVVGIIVLAAFTDKHEPGPPAAPDPRETPAPSTTPPPTAPERHAPTVPAAHAPAATAPSVAPEVPVAPDARPSESDAPPPTPAGTLPATAPGDAAAPADAATAPPDATAALAAGTPPARTCYAEVSSQPSGAEIVLGDSNVVGTTPQKIALPCGRNVDLTIRKGRLVSTTRTITPTPDGAKIKVTLGKQTFLVKVSSTPVGATITLNGKAIGVTPTTIKIPAFEQSILTITKDGYATDTAKVSPKSAGVSVHTALKRLEIRPR